MKGDRLGASVLAVKMIPNVDAKMAEKLGMPKGWKSLGILTADADDVTYCALDEACKNAEVSVVMGKSFYGGAANANSRLAGEVIGMLAGPSPAEVRSGLNVAIDFIENEFSFYSANEDDSIAYFAQCISRTGSFLSGQAGIREGEPLAYLIAPPLEAMYGLDAAMKAADVTLCQLFEPPSETNFGGALLTGSQSACKAACDAFADAVRFVAENPKHF
ncbi:ethanolamine utilization microcompartment protein EutL [Endozoicomonas sp. GU-1]|uniref:ethanolamine utilization microcompartment protein EutL n=2 Tax=Endozoicomonas sp. GU-1 TaxID=3009078 RepID=UPI0022B412BA|nr:ethanolamine utilization microcompartment protein EutL [Endozoicomonas sp. GU-1]WBA84339.1 ethanolamine utilization microcompartment protein EutL [Endozoicomonas sp. GU-1]